MIECSREACDRDAKVKGMCRRHYHRAWRATAQGLPNNDVAERFHATYTRGSSTECWPWRGHRDDSGHGRFYHSAGRYRPAHSFALELATGQPCPPGREACHHCDNPPCVNPAHVYYGTRLDNMRDMRERGRSRRGLDRHNAVLSDADVMAIRERAAVGTPGKWLAHEFNVSESHVSELVRGHKRPHVPGPIRARKSGGPMSADEPEVRPVTLNLCRLCTDGVGGECHVPGCALYMSQAPDILPRIDTPATEPYEGADQCPSCGGYGICGACGEGTCDGCDGIGRRPNSGEAEGNR